MSSRIDAGIARAGFERAHMPIPAALAGVDPHEQLALCVFIGNPGPNDTTPTTECPNGSVITTQTEYAVDANLTKILLPDQKYLYPDIPGLGSPPSVCDPPPP